MRGPQWCPPHSKEPMVTGEMCCTDPGTVQALSQRVGAFILAAWWRVREKEGMEKRAAERDPLTPIPRAVAGLRAPWAELL